MSKRTQPTFEETLHGLDRACEETTPRESEERYQEEKKAHDAALQQRKNFIRASAGRRRDRVTQETEAAGLLPCQQCGLPGQEYSYYSRNGPVTCEYPPRPRKPIVATLCGRCWMGSSWKSSEEGKRIGLSSEIQSLKGEIQKTKRMLRTLEQSLERLEAENQVHCRTFNEEVEACRLLEVEPCELCGKPSEACLVENRVRNLCYICEVHGSHVRRRGVCEGVV